MDTALETTSAKWQVRHLGFGAPQRVEWFEYEEDAPPPGCFRLRTLFCGLSTGTELTHFSGSSPYLHSHWDDELKLFRDDGPHEQYPFPFSGYMQVGRVESSRYDGVRDGEIIAMSYGHKSGHTVCARDELFYPLPGSIEPMLGIYVAQMGPICANGILHADAELYGAQAQSFGAGVRDKRVLVCGTGVIGLMTALMCREAGAAEVAVAGRNAWKLDVAQKLGLTPINSTQVDVGEWAKAQWHDGAGTRGADVAFQCTGAPEMLGQALRALQPQAAVIDLGFYQGGAESVQFGREFHHNGLKHICAQISRVPRALQNTWNWRRLSLQTIEFLRAAGEQVREHLITHVLPFEQAQQAFDLLAHDGKETLQVVLQCETNPNRA